MHAMATIGCNRILQMTISKRLSSANDMDLICIGNKFDNSINDRGKNVTTKSTLMIEVWAKYTLEGAF